MSYEPVEIRKDGYGAGQDPMANTSGSGPYAISGYAASPVKTGTSGGAKPSYEVSRTGSSEAGGGVEAISSQNRVGNSAGVEAYSTEGGNYNEGGVVGGPVRKITPHPVIAIGVSFCIHNH